MELLNIVEDMALKLIITMVVVVERLEDLRVMEVMEMELA